MILKIFVDCTDNGYVSVRKFRIRCSRKPLIKLVIMPILHYNLRNPPTVCGISENHCRARIQKPIRIN